MTVEEILEAMRAIIEAAEGRNLTDEEATNYEKLEAQLVAARRTAELKARQRAYDTPVRDKALEAVAHIGATKVDDTYNKAFNHYLRTGKPNADLIQNAQQVGTDSEGGYLVSPQFRQKLVEVQKAFGGLAAEVDSFSTERGGDIEFPTLDDTSSVGAITAEEAAFANGQDLVFGTVTLKAWKYTSSGAGTNTPLRVSVELLQDAEFDIEGLVARALGTRIMRAQAAHWVTGTGSANTQPLGLLNGSATTVNLATTTTITYADLLAIEGALDPAYEQNAKWVMSKAAWTAIRGIEDDAGRPLILPQAQSGAGSQPTRELLGYPVVLDQGCPAPSGDDTNFLAFGDLRESYVIRRVAPLTVIVNPYTRMNNGQVEYVAWERADGTVQNTASYVIGATQDVP
jgi:HK97 family phage major capsid protein